MSIANGHEKRQFGRRTTSLHAWIIVPGRPKLPCIVRNISVGGALLELDLPSWLPYNFRLLIDTSNFASDCEIRHHGPRSVGVRFIEAAGLREQSGDPGARSSADADQWMGQGGAANHAPSPLLPGRKFLR